MIRRPGKAMPDAGGSPPDDKPRVVRIAIVGGGCAGMTAAWELCKSNQAPPLCRQAG